MDCSTGCKVLLEADVLMIRFVVLVADIQAGLTK